MGKNLLAYCCINVLVITCGVIFLWLHYNPEPFNDLGRTTLKPTKVVTILEHGPRYARGIKIIAGFSALLLVGCMFWVVYRKIKKGNHDRIDECLIKKEEMESTSLWEWAIALFICPGCLILPVFIAVFFGFSHFW